MGRSDATQQPPEAGQSLAGFPTRHVGAGTSWSRAHRESLGPWFFASEGGGRFDLPHPRGTCYLANTPETAARELIGPELIGAGRVTDAFLTDRVVSKIPLPSPVKAAKLTSNYALDHRVSNELSSMPDYSLTQQWAQAFDEQGFTGIWYRPRFSPGKGRALGVFGPSGPSACDVLERRPLRAVVEEMIDIHQVHTSSLSDYQIIDDPHDP